MKKKRKKIKIIEAPKQSEKDIKNQPEVEKEIISIEHPHGENEENDEQIAREHPHETNTPVAYDTSESIQKGVK